jgi:hypothetical protein
MEGWRRRIEKRKARLTRAFFVYSCQKHFYLLCDHYFSAESAGKNLRILKK